MDTHTLYLFSLSWYLTQMIVRIWFGQNHSATDNLHSIFQLLKSNENHNSSILPAFGPK